MAEPRRQPGTRTKPKKLRIPDACLMHHLYLVPGSDSEIAFKVVRIKPQDRPLYPNHPKCVTVQLIDGEWLYGKPDRWKRPDIRPPLYREREFLETARSGKRVLVCEGERDADACEARDMPATCAAHNAWKAEHFALIADALVEGHPHADAAERTVLRVCADRDAEGERKAKEVVEGVQQALRAVERPDLAERVDWAFPRGDYNDVAEYLDAEHPLVGDD